MPYDGTTKTSIPPDRLPPVWATRINAFANKLIEWQLRPAEWADYLSQVSSVREDTTFVLRDLLRALIAHFKTKRKHKAVGARLNMKARDSLRDKLGKGISLPQQAVDDWGFVTDGLESNGQNNAQRIEQGFALSAYDSYLKSQLRAYLENPAAHWKEPERRAMAKMWHAVDQVPRRLAVALASLEPESIQARILKQPDTWENTPALWITLDSNEPLDAFTAPGLVKPLLRQTVLDADLDEEQSRTLSRRWEQVVLVPLFCGRAWDQHAWVVPTYRLTSQDPSSDFEWLDQIPRAVSNDIWIRTGLRRWNSAEMANARELLNAIGRFKILTAHLSSVLELVQKGDADREVLQAYIHRYQDEWSEIIQALIDGTGAVVERFNRLTEEQKERRPFLVEAVSGVYEHFHDWLPPGLNTGEAVLSVDACASWLDTATANIEALDAVGGAFLLDSVVQTATLSVTEQGSSA